MSKYIVCKHFKTFPIFYCRETCLERPPVLKDHSFMASGEVFQDRFNCTRLCFTSEHNPGTHPTSSTYHEPGPEMSVVGSVRRPARLNHQHLYEVHTGPHEVDVARRDVLLERERGSLSPTTSNLVIPPLLATLYGSHPI